VNYPDFSAPAYTATDLSSDELKTAVGMFRAHAKDDGLLDRQEFSGLLVEVFAWNFISRPRNIEVQGHIRSCIANGRLTRNINTTSALFERVWRRLSPSGEELAMEPFVSGLAAISSKDFVAGSEFLFYLTDLRDQHALSQQDLLDFLRTFVQFYTQLQMNVLEVERSALLLSGIQGGAISRHVSEIKDMAGDSEAIIARQVQDTFTLVDTDIDGNIDETEWRGSRGRLPKLYNKLLSMCQSMLSDVKIQQPRYAPSQVPSLDGLGFTEEEVARVVELFQAHSVDGRMDDRRFVEFLLEGFAYSFITRDHDDSSRMYLRLCIANGRVGRGVDINSPLFWRTFQYFDTDGRGVLSLRDVGTGLAKISKGSFECKAAYMFFVTDLNDNEELSYSEIVEFFRYFVEFFAALAKNVYSIERPFLVRAGLSDSIIDQQIADVNSQLDNAEAYILAQTSQTFEQLDLNHDQNISYAEWIEGKGKLPKMYNKLTNMCIAIVQCQSPAFQIMAHERRSKATTVPELQGLDLTVAEAELVADFFKVHSVSERMSFPHFCEFLVEAFAFSFLPGERDQAAREAILDGIINGGLTNDIDFCSPVFERSFRFFDVEQKGELDLGAFGTGLAKMGKCSYNDCAQYMFYVADRNDKGCLEETDFLAFFNDLLTLIHTLHTNVLVHTKPYLVEQGTSALEVEQKLALLAQNRAFVAESVEAEMLSALELLDRGAKASRIAKRSGAGDNVVTFEEFLNSRGRLPKLFGQFRAMCESIIQEAEAVFPLM